MSMTKINIQLSRRTTHTKHNTWAPKVPKKLDKGPIYPNLQTDIDKPAGPWGCIKSKSFIEPKDNFYWSLLFYTRPQNSQLLFSKPTNRPLLGLLMSPAGPLGCFKLKSYIKAKVNVSLSPWSIFKRFSWASRAFVVSKSSIELVKNNNNFDFHE